MLSCVIYRFMCIYISTYLYVYMCIYIYAYIYMHIVNFHLLPRYLCLNSNQQPSNSVGTCGSGSPGTRRVGTYPCLAAIAELWEAPVRTGDIERGRSVVRRIGSYNLDQHRCLLEKGVNASRSGVVIVKKPFN